MPIRPLPRVAALAAVLFFCAAAAAPPAAALDCEKQIDRTLRELNLPQDAATEIRVIRRSAGANPSSNYTLDAWVRLESCASGALVVHMTRYCLVQDVYTTGGCHVADLSGY